MTETKIVEFAQTTEPLKIPFAEIASGNWTVLVEVLDANEKLAYMGEASTTVKPSATEDVSITLSKARKVEPDESIQEAIDASADGEIIVVAPGTYVEDLMLTDKNVILRSTEQKNSTVVEKTIIDDNSKQAEGNTMNGNTPDDKYSPQ